ncbi:hypothetical protein ERJ75_000477400 [Trypanosoma vivax]|nr:hypothetical protein ERJ75_000477400 [Trypanosoma vivax]
MKGVIVAAKKKVVLDEKATVACEVVKKPNGMKDTLTTFPNVTKHVAAMEADLFKLVRELRTEAENARMGDVGVTGAVDACGGGGGCLFHAVEGFGCRV